MPSIPTRTNCGWTEKKVWRKLGASTRCIASWLLGQLMQQSNIYWDLLLVNQLIFVYLSIDVLVRPFWDRWLWSPIWVNNRHAWSTSSVPPLSTHPCPLPFTLSFISLSRDASAEWRPAEMENRWALPWPGSTYGTAWPWCRIKGTGSQVSGLCQIYGDWGEELHQDTDVMAEGKQPLKNTGEVGYLMSTSASCMPCHCERPP